VGFLLGLEQRLLAVRLGVALGVLGDAEGLFFGAADGFRRDAAAVGNPPRDDGGGRDGGDGEVDEIAEVLQHA